MVLEIAGIGLEVRAAEPGIVLVTDAAHEPFLAEDRGDDCASIVLAPVTSPRPPRRGGKTLFDTGTVWRLEALDGGHHLLTLRSPLYGADPYLVVEFDPQYTRGQGETLDGGPHLAGGTMHPFVYPFDEVVFLARLARGRGVLVHACGVAHAGRGILLLGTSGAGKSTSARLWSDRPASRVLSDDRIVIRHDADTYRIYGTPWHGEAELSLATRIPLADVYLLVQAPANEIRPLPRPAAVASLFGCTFPLFYDETALSFTLGILDRLATRVPVRELRFTREREAVDLVLREGV